MQLFGFLSTLILFILYEKFKKHNKILSKIPSMVSVGVILILVLKIFKIDYQTYYHSASALAFLITPATIALAYPLYKNSHILTKDKRALYPAIIIATLSAVISTYFCAKFLGAEFRVIMSLLPKSTTMPIALEISKTLGGYSELTACIVAMTGVFGGIFGHYILKFLKIKNDVAIGLALGSASHVIGTAACVEKKKERQITASTIALILTGLLSAIIIPLARNYY